MGYRFIYIIYKFDIYQIAGQEKFRNIVPQHYRGVNGVVFVFDVSNKSSFESLSTKVILPTTNS